MSDSEDEESPNKKPKPSCEDVVSTTAEESARTVQNDDVKSRGNTLKLFDVGPKDAGRFSSTSLSDSFELYRRSPLCLSRVLPYPLITSSYSPLPAPHPMSMLPIHMTPMRHGFGHVSPT